MLCKSPYMIGPLPCACGRCMPCRVNKKRNWAMRLELELTHHKEACVVTLTYNDLNLPDGGSLEKTDAQLWLKSFRKVLAPLKIRFFLAGEYGTKTKRPHFHAIIFGISALVAGGADGRSGLVAKTWKRGYVYVDKCSKEAIAYVAGYVTKKLGTTERESGGLKPEFIRMSLRPGIGAKSAKNIARALSSDVGLESIKAHGDVPFTLRLGSKNVSIGRYLRGKIRNELFLPTEAPAAKTKAYWQEMWTLRKKAESDPLRKASSFKDYLVDMNAQKINNLEARTKIFADNDTF